MRLELTDYIRVSIVAADYNVSYGAVKNFFVRAGEWRYPYLITKGRANYLRLDIAEFYGQGRTTARPKGYVSVKRALDGLPLRGRKHLERLEQAGQITVVRFRKNLYLPPDDARYLRQTLLDRLPLAGWVPLKSTAQAAGVTSSALATWLKRRNVEIRIYLDVETHQFARFFERKHAFAYLAQRPGATELEAA